MNSNYNLHTISLLRQQRLLLKVLGRFNGKDITINDIEKFPEILSNKAFLPIEKMGVEEWKCLYCTSLNNKDKYNCHNCGAPKR